MIPPYFLPCRNHAAGEFCSLAMDASQKKQLPFISILVMGYNQAAYMEACADSVLAQQYDGPLEIIFCDDCSTDNTFAVMEQKAAAYRGPHRVITHRCPVNGKVAVNMNVAVSLSHGDWLMRVDGDDILHPDRTRLTALAIMLHPEATAISGKLIPFEHTPPLASNPPDDSLNYLVVDKTQLSPNRKPSGFEWWGCMMTLSRRIFTEFGDLPACCNVLDDTMFASRALMLGQFVIIRNGILLYYRRHANNISSEAPPKTRQSVLQIMRQEKASRHYYHRGIPSHAPILHELEQYTATHPECQGLLDFFRARFTALRKLALYWEMSWTERLKLANIPGSFLRKLPHAFSTLCPFTYAISRWLKQK